MFQNHCYLVVNIPSPHVLGRGIHAHTPDLGRALQHLFTPANWISAKMKCFCNFFLLPVISIVLTSYIFFHWIPDFIPKFFPLFLSFFFPSGNTNSINIKIQCFYKRRLYFKVSSSITTYFRCDIFRLQSVYRKLYFSQLHPIPCM